jgi:hypothetical protein
MEQILYDTSSLINAYKQRKHRIHHRPVQDKTSGFCFNLRANASYKIQSKEPDLRYVKLFCKAKTFTKKCLRYPQQKLLDCTSKKELA